MSCACVRTYERVRAAAYRGGKNRLPAALSAEDDDSSVGDLFFPPVAQGRPLSRAVRSSYAPPSTIIIFIFFFSLSFTTYTEPVRRVRFVCARTSDDTVDHVIPDDYYGPFVGLSSSASYFPALPSLGVRIRAVYDFSSRSRCCFYSDYVFLLLPHSPRP